MPELSHDEAIDALRKLPEDKQREALGRLTPEGRAGIMAKLKAGATSATPTPLGNLDYHPPGTDATPLGSFGDKYIRPIANTERAFIRTPAALFQSAKEAITTIPQSVKDFAHPVDATRRHAGIRIAPNSEPLPDNTDATPGPAPKVDYDRELTNLIGGAAAQWLIAEGIIRTPEIAREVKTPGTMRRMAQNLTGVGTQKVASLVEDTVQKAGEDADTVRAKNKKADESTLYDRGVVDEKNQNTAGQVKRQLNQRREAIRKNREATKTHAAKVEETRAENEKTTRAHKDRQARETELAETSRTLDRTVEETKTAETAANKGRWDALRKANAGAETDITPLRETVKAAAAQADPASSPIFASIVRDAEAEERPVTVDGLEIGVENPKYDEIYEATYGEPPPLAGEGGMANFDRLQRWYSYITNRMYGGTRLEGGTYHAMDMVRKGLNNAMQEITKQTGTTGDLAKARESHTNLMEAFSDSPNQAHTVDSKVVQEHSPEYIKEQQRQERLAKLTRYNPEIGSLSRHVDNLREGVKALPNPAPMREQVQNYPPAPARVPVPKPGSGIIEGSHQYAEPHANTPIERPDVNVHDVRAEAIKKLANRLSLSGYDFGILMSSLLAHPLIAMLGAAGEGLRVGAVGYVAGKSIARTALESPKIIEWLAKPSVEDIRVINQIPNVERVKIISGITQAAIEQANKGGPVKLAVDAARMIGPHNVALIAAASAAGRPKTAGEAKKKAAELQGSTSKKNSDFMATPNPKGLVEPGNLNIRNRPIVENADGSHSTEYSTSFQDDKGREVLVPTVVNGRFLTPDGKKPAEGSTEEKKMFQAAWQHYLKTGENLGKFDNADNADAYAQQLHSRGEQR